MFVRFFPEQYCATLRVFCRACSYTIFGVAWRCSVRACVVACVFVCRYVCVCVRVFVRFCAVFCVCCIFYNIFSICYVPFLCAIFPIFSIFPIALFFHMCYHNSIGGTATTERPFHLVALTVRQGKNKYEYSKLNYQHLL